MEEAYVVSDLHLGGGDTEPTLEDFDQDDALAAFIGRISRPGVTLFINGDFIDFPQIPPYDVGPADHLLWDEATSLHKLETALAAHPVSVDALRRFVQSGGRLSLHVGNHDLDLAWPGVQKRLYGAIGASGDTLQFRLTHAVYHGVHIEHGHMFTPENAPRTPDAFIHSWRSGDSAERQYLERVWGTDFMLQFYNDLERQYPFADNVKPMLMVVYYGLRNRWIGAGEIVRLVLFLKRTGLPLEGIASAVLAGPPEEEAAVLSLADEEWRRAIAERLATDPAFRAEFKATIAALPPEQQRLLGESRSVRVEVGPRPGGATGATLGIFREARQLRAARERLSREGVTHVVFGHTHEVIDGELDGCLYNPGTWLPSLDFSRADVGAKIKKHGITLDILRDGALYVRVRKVVHIVPDPHNSQRRARVELVLADDVRETR